MMMISNVMGIGYSILVLLLNAGCIKLSGSIPFIILFRTEFAKVHIIHRLNFSMWWFMLVPDSCCNFHFVAVQSVSRRNREKSMMIGFSSRRKRNFQLNANRRKLNRVLVRRHPRQQFCWVIVDATFQNGSVCQLNSRNFSADRSGNRKNCFFASQRFGQGKDSNVIKLENEQLGNGMAFGGEQNVLFDPAKVWDVVKIDFGIENKFLRRIEAAASDGEASSTGSGCLKMIEIWIYENLT